MGRTSDAKERLMEAVSHLIWEGSYGSTTIDQICEKAGVKKGSFYYFFDSKADLAVVAIEEEWQKQRAELDAIFSPTVPPLERFRKYCEYGYKYQAEISCECGCVLGCPLFSLGAEVSTLEDALRQKVQEILEYKRQYLETAIRDAHAAGLANAPDAVAKARMLFAYYQGLLTEARIQNSLAVLKEALNDTYALIGANVPATTMA
jgi:TetR/AcrR family transcriptional regulator, transcriptional repressor for nem operon